MKQHFEQGTLLLNESLFTTANGYIGVRGSFEEGYPEGYESNRGTYLNGFYDTHQIKYSESAYGFPTIGETIVPVMDAQNIQIRIDGDTFRLDKGTIPVIKRGIDLDAGIVYRKVTWESPKGHVLNFQFNRMASFVQEELLIISLIIESVNYSGKIEIESTIDGQITVLEDKDDPRVATGHIKPLKIINASYEEQLMYMTGQTDREKSKVCLACSHDLKGDVVLKESQLVFSTSLDISIDHSARLTKYIVYTDSNKHQNLEEEAMAILETAKQKGAAFYFEGQAKYMDQFWSRCQITIEGDKTLTEAIRYSQYQLLAASGKDGKSQVAAKGLTGAGYEGHYFWDTEIYVMPFFTLTQPEIAKQLLAYRYSILDQCKARSLELGHERGAKIPWRTISGRECSSYFPAGTAQYHINSDVAYGVIQYYLMTEDIDMMQEFGYELLVETARLWLEVGHYDHEEFCIDGVTGPDEYTAIVNNNYYTNAMAKYHMNWVVKLYDEYKHLNLLSPEERNAMQEASERMRLPFDQALGINKQDDSFLNKRKWDFKGTPKEQYPLLLHFHPLKIYRHQVLKQADTVLAHFLLDDVSDQVMEQSYNYYEALTTHDSSLSPCVYGMMASRINKPEQAYDFLMKTVYLDLENLHHNTQDGIHIANAGGTFMAIVYGFGGLRIKADGVHLKPTKPHHWTSYSFSFVHQGSTVHVKVADQLSIQTDGPIKLTIDDKTYEIQSHLEVAYHGKH